MASGGEGGGGGAVVRQCPRVRGRILAEKIEEEKNRAQENT